MHLLLLIGSSSCVAHPWDQVQILCRQPRRYNPPSPPVNTKSYTIQSSVVYKDLMVHWRRLVTAKKSQAMIDAIAARIVTLVDQDSRERGTQPLINVIAADNEVLDNNALSALDEAINEFERQSHDSLGAVYARINPADAEGAVSDQGRANP